MKFTHSLHRLKNFFVFLFQYEILSIFFHITFSIRNIYHAGCSFIFTSDTLNICRLNLCFVGLVSVGYTRCWYNHFGQKKSSKNQTTYLIQTVRSDDIHRSTKVFEYFNGIRLSIKVTGTFKTFLTENLHSPYEEQNIHINLPALF